MTSKGGVLIYRCRRCGEEVQNTHIPNLRLGVVSIAGNFWPADLWGGPAPRLVDLHVFCRDQFGVAGVGVTDLIGGQEDAD